MKPNYGLNVVSRRSTLKAIGGGVLLGGVAVTPASARSDTLAHELNTVRAATRKYRDVALARADGYGTVVSPYTPEMGFHFVNPALLALTTAPDSDRVGSGTVDLAEPPILVYTTTGSYNPAPGDVHEPDRDDDLRLSAVEFGHLADDGSPGTPADYFSDEDSSRNLKVTEEEGWEWVPGPAITALHVWVHRNNPAGVFHPTNPTID